MENRNNMQEDEISKVFSDPIRLQQILQKGIRAALLKHKQAGNPVCKSHNGKVVWVQPEEI